MAARWGLLIAAGATVVALHAAAQAQQKPPVQAAPLQTAREIGIADAARAFQPLADRAVAALARGDTNGFKAMMSPNFRREQGDRQIDSVLVGAIAPFFADFAANRETAHVAPLADRWGSVGVSFYRSFVSTSGQAKPFALYVVNEGGRPVIANIVTNRAFTPERK